MKKGNIIHLFPYEKQKHHETNDKEHLIISEELKVAIQHLIHRLRETGPIKK